MLSIKKLATAFAGITFALSCVCSAWGANPVTIQDANGHDISVYEVSPGFYQSGTTYNNSTDFYITNVNGLKYFRDLVNGDETVCAGYPELPRNRTVHAFSGKTVHLWTDIDLNNEPWEPIGYAYQTNERWQFEGSFDGGIYDELGNLTGTHKISNLNVSIASGKYYAGLFGVYNASANSTLKNLTLDGVTISSGQSAQGVGAFVGSAKNAQAGVTLENLHVIGNVSIVATTSYVGGIVGDGRCTIRNCSVATDGTIKGSYNVGGIAGGLLTRSTGMYGCAVTNATVQTSSYNYGLGALAGFSRALNVSNCTASAATVKCEVSSYAGQGMVGLLVGFADSTTAYTILSDNTVINTTATEYNTSVTTQVGALHNDYAIVGNNITYDESGKVTGGIFENIPTAAIAEGYLSTDNPDTTTSASYPLTIGGPYEAVLYDGNDALIQGYTTLKAAFEAVNGASVDTVVIKILKDVETAEWTSEVDLEWTKNVVIDTTVAAGVTINLENVNLFDENGKDMVISENVTISKVGQLGSYQANTVTLNGNVNAYQLWAYQGTVFVNPSANVTLYTDGQMGMWSGGHYAIQGDLADAVNANIGSLTPQINGGYFKYFFGNNSVSLKDTYVNAALVTWDDRYSNYQFDLSLTNSILVVGSENQTGLDLGSQSTGIISLQSSRIISSVGRVTINANDTVYMDWKSSITATTFANNGVINIDATGIAEPVKVIDYTGSGTMALADYGTVNVTGGTAYVDGNDLWITMPPVAEAYDAEGGTLIGQFATVNEAIAASGATYVKLLDNVTLTAPLTMTNSYTLDFNGKTNYYNTTATTQIKGNSNIIFKNGKLDISGAQMPGTAAGNDIFSFNVDGNTLTFDNMELYGDGYGGYSVFWFKGNDTTPVNTLNFENGSSIVLKDEAYGTGGVFKGPGAYHENQFFVVNITDSTVSCTNVYRFSLYGTINVKDSTVTFTGGENAFRQGIFTFDHATVTVSGANANEGKGIVPRFSDTIVTNGSALTFIGSNISKDVLFEYANNIVIYDTSTVTAASVSSAAAGAIVAPANYVLVTTDNGGASVTYSVAPAVAQIGDTLYATFADAIAAAEEYKTENGYYPVITVLDATAEQTNDGWMFTQDGQRLVRKVAMVTTNVDNYATTNYYASAAEAFSAAESAVANKSGTGASYAYVTLLADDMLPGDATTVLKSNHGSTDRRYIDLNGHTLTAPKGISLEYKSGGFQVYLQDGSAGQTGRVVNPTADAPEAFVFTVGSSVSLTVEGGAIVAKGEGTALKTTGGGRITLKGGSVTADPAGRALNAAGTTSITAEADSSVSVTGTLGAPTGELILRGGTFTANAANGELFDVGETGSVAVSGGSFSSAVPAQCIATGYKDAGQTAVVSGYYTVTKEVYTITFLDENDNVIISGQLEYNALYSTLPVPAIPVKVSDDPAFYYTGAWAPSASTSTRATSNATHKLTYTQGKYGFQYGDGLYTNTFANAYKAVADGGTVTVLTNAFALTSTTLNLAKDVTVDLNGSTLSMNNTGMLTVSGEGTKVTFVNGTIKYGSGTTARDALVKVTSPAEVAFEGVTIQGASYYTTAVSVASGASAAFSGECVVTMPSGKQAVTAADGGTVAISGGLYSTEVPVAYCAANYKPADGTVEYDGKNYYTVTLKGVAQIGDVKYTSFAEAIAAAEAYKTENGDYPTITVLDDTAEQTNPDWKIANGLLVKKVYVAQIVVDNGATTNKYETLAEALGAAQTDDTVTLIADAVLASQFTFNAGKDITLDLAGHAITSTSDDLLYVVNGTLTVNDSVGGGSVFTDNWTVFNVAGGEVVVNGGKFGATQHNTIYRSSGSIVFNGGMVDMAQSSVDQYCGEYVQTFEGFGDNAGYTIFAESLVFDIDPSTYETTAVGVSSTAQLDASCDYGATLTWSSSDTTIATVDSTGLVTFTGVAGSAMIYAAAQNGSYATAMVAVGTPTVRNETTGDEYVLLQSAFDDASVGDSLKLLANVSLSGTAYVYDGSELTLDLAGYTVSGASIANYGTLTIDDSVGNGGITAGAGADAAIVNDDTGVMNIKSGLIDGTATGVNAAVRVYSGTVTIDGGTFRSDTTSGSHYAIQNRGGTLIINDATVDYGFGAVGNWSGSVTTINGGTFLPTGRKGATCHVVYVDGTSNVTVNDGVFKMNYPVDAVPDSGVALASFYNGTVRVYGGSFTGHFTTYAAAELSSGSLLYGGKFSSKTWLASYCAPDYKVTDTADADGMYAVVPKGVAKIGSTYYQTFAEAIAAAEEYKTEHGEYPTITVLDTTAEQNNPHWKFVTDAGTGVTTLVHKVYAKDDEVVVVGDDDYPITQTEADFLNDLLDRGGENYSRDAITDALADMSVEDFQEAALLNIDITKTYAKPVFSITAIKRNRTAGTVSVTVTLTRENKVAQPIRGTLILETSSDCVNWDGCQDVQLYDEHFSESDTAVITMPIAKNARIFKAKVVDPAEITSGTGE